LFRGEFGDTGGVGIGLRIERGDVLFEGLLFRFGYFDSLLQGFFGGQGLAGLYLGFGDLALGGENEEQQHCAEAAADTVNK